MSRADEYRAALDGMGLEPFQMNMDYGDWIAENHMVIRRALRIAEMLEQLQESRVPLSYEQAAYQALLKTQGSMQSVVSIAFKAMAAELIKQAEDGEKQ